MMNKPLVLLADTDANYLISLEEKLTEELFGQIDLEIITDIDYFENFFSTPQRVNTLIISENLYTQSIQRQNIETIFILTEEFEPSVQSSESVIKIFKYSSTKEILNQVIYSSKDILNVQINHKETQIIVITSPSGGTGKTTVSFALASSLAHNHKRVFYITTDSMQSFSFFLENKTPLPASIARIISEADDKLYGSVMPYIRNEQFAYLPPFGRNIISLGMDMGIYPRIINAIKETKEYDYIIVDTAVSFDDTSAGILKDADKVLVLVTQDRYSTYKATYFVENIDCRDNDKFIFVCNKFRRDIPNNYLESPIGQQFIISEYIDDVPLHKQDQADNYMELLGIRNLAYIFS